MVEQNEKALRATPGHYRKRPWPVVHVAPEDADYPAILRKDNPPVPELSIIGEAGLLAKRPLALFCSIKCPGSIIVKTYETMQLLKLQDRVIAGGFHSPMERTCLDILLRGRAGIILSPARGIRRLRIRPEWRTVLAEKRMLVISPFEDPVRRSTLKLAGERNRFVARIADELLIPFAARGSRTEAFAAEMIRAGKPVFTFCDPESQPLIDLGAVPLPE